MYLLFLFQNQKTRRADSLKVQVPRGTMQSNYTTQKYRLLRQIKNIFEKNVVFYFYKMKLLHFFWKNSLVYFCLVFFSVLYLYFILSCIISATKTRLHETMVSN